MNLDEFSQLIAAKRRELDKLMRRRMPVIVGRMAKDHFQDNFRQGGFVDGGLHPWQKTKRQSHGGADAASQYGPLLSSRKHLFKSVKYMPTDYRVVVADELSYAPIHNWGGSISVSVTDRMRHFAWARFYNAAGIKRKAATGKRKGKKRNVSAKAQSPQAQFWRNLALTRKTKLNIRIPQRKFLGESKELSQKINSRMEEEIRNILNK